MTTEIACAVCGTSSSGRFCSRCGAMLGGSACAECATPMSPGARFCHRCGASSIGGASGLRRSTDAAVPWAVAAIAMLALVAMVAGRQFRGPGSQSNVTPLSAPTAEGVVRGPDISQMTPGQRAESLRDRVIRLSEAGHADSVRFFAPMAIASYQMIDRITDEQRFDLGRIGMLSGVNGIARAQADTLLSRDPSDLLGLTLAFNAAQADRDTAGERTLKNRLLAASTASRAGPPRSGHHQAAIEDAIRHAKR